MESYSFHPLSGYFAFNYDKRMANQETYMGVSIPFRGILFSTIKLYLKILLENLKMFPSPFGVFRFQPIMMKLFNAFSIQMAFPSPFGVFRFQLHLLGYLLLLASRHDLRRGEFFRKRQLASPEKISPKATVYEERRGFAKS